MPLRGLTWGVVLGAFIMPPYLAAIGWILLAGPNAGWINQAWTAVTGDPDSLVNVYTFTGLAVVIALNSFPFIFIFVKAALRSEERRGGKECVRTGRSRGWPGH